MPKSIRVVGSYKRRQIGPRNLCVAFGHEGHFDYDLISKLRLRRTTTAEGRPLRHALTYEPGER